MGSSRRTLQRAIILRTMLEAPLAEWYGLELSRYAGLKSGTIYPALAGLEQSGLLCSRWEDVDPTEARRPRRRLYRLIPEQADEARAYVAQYATALTPKRTATKPAPRVTVFPKGGTA